MFFNLYSNSKMIDTAAEKQSEGVLFFRYQKLERYIN